MQLHIYMYAYTTLIDLINITVHIINDIFVTDIQLHD